MKKRLLSILCVLALCLSLLPATALAAAASDTVYVGGVELDCTDGKTVYALTDSTGAVSEDDADVNNWNIKFETGTLTLKDATIRQGYRYSPIEDTAGIYATEDLTIVLEGTNEIAGTADAPLSMAVYIRGNLTIRGSGSVRSLQAVSSNTDGITTAIYATQTLTIEDCAVQAKASGSESVQTTIAALYGDTLSIQNAQIDAEASGRQSSGIKNWGDALTITNSTVTAEGEKGIFTSEALCVSGSSVTARATGGDAIDCRGSATIGGEPYDPDAFLGSPQVTIQPDNSVIIPKTYDIWVAGTQISNENADDVLGDGTVSYDPSINTLTLNGANITTAYKDEFGDQYGIYAAANLRVELVGMNTITLSGSGRGISVGIGNERVLDIYGDGSVQIAVSGEWSCGITAETLCITGSTLDIKASGSGSSGICGESIIVSSSTLTAEGEGCAIDAGFLTVGGSAQSIAASTKVTFTRLDEITWSGHYLIWVNGTRVSDENADDVLGDGTVSYDPAANTLTLNGANITTAYEDEFGDQYGIYAESSLNLNLAGENTVTLTASGTEYYAGIWIDEALNISGGGSLTVTASASGSTGGGDGIYSGSDLEIVGSTVTATVTGSGSYGLYTDGSMYIDKASTVTATSDLEGYAAYVDNMLLLDVGVYQLKEDAALFKVEQGAVLAGAEIVPVEVLYVNGVDMRDDAAEKPQGVRYDAATNTLTLTDAQITQAYTDTDGYTSGIYAEGFLTIELVGDSTIKQAEDSFDNGIYIFGDLAITGSGSLAAEGSNGIYSSDALTVHGGSITGEGYLEYGIRASDMTVYGGSVTGTGISDCGIYVEDGDLTVHGGSVTGTSQYQDGIMVSFGKLTMTGGSVTGKGEEAAVLLLGSDSVVVEDVIILPPDYLPSGYTLQSVRKLNSGSMSYFSIVPPGGTLDYDADGYLTGAAKSVTLKAGQSTDPGGSTGGGSSGGGSSSSGGSSSGSTTETTQNPDGSTTTTVTKPDGSTTETTKKPDGSQEVVNTDKDGNVTTTTTDTDGNKTETVEKTDGSSQTTVTNKDGSGSTTTASQNGRVEVQVKLPAAVVDSAAEKGEAVKLPMPAIPVVSDGETAPTVTAELPAGQSAKVEIPVENPTAGTVAVLVKADGSEEIIKTSVTSETGVVVTLQDGDKVKIVDNSTEFADVADTYWGAEAVDFVSSRELMNGVGNGLFAPDDKLTRGQLCQLLYNLEDASAFGDSTFTDVADGAWYADAVAWAAFQDIVSGYGNGAFGPNDPITREQLTVMLYRYAQRKGYDVDVDGDTNILSYTDALEISEYAVSAMQWACGAGIIHGTGDGSTLSPLGEATRTEVAAMLMRFCENVVK